MLRTRQKMQNVVENPNGLKNENKTETYTLR
jgi:hypothetical protein